MKRWFNVFVQGVSIGGHVINQYGSLIPPKYQGPLAGVLAIVQAVTALASHNFNPDGTPATTAYRPDGK